MGDEKTTDKLHLLGIKRTAWFAVLGAKDALSVSRARRWLNGSTNPSVSDLADIMRAARSLGFVDPFEVLDAIVQQQTARSAQVVDLEQ